MKQNTDYSAYILPVGILLLSYTVLKRIGIIPDKTKEQTETAQLFKDYFSPDYLRQLRKKYKVMIFSPTGAGYIAQQIFEAKGTFNDDEGKLFAAIKAILYKTQVSQIAEIFANKYKKDLAQYLGTFLNAEELQRIYNYFDNLPGGFRK